MKPTKLFIYSAGGILLAAALIRFAIVAGDAPVLTLPEPMFRVPLCYAVLLVGAFELLVAFLCLFGKRTGLQLGGVAWLATNFMVYRISLYTMHCHPQATCIGSLTDPLQLARGITRGAGECMTLYLLLGSYAAILRPWIFKAGTRLLIYRQAQEVLKMSCPACGVHIKFARQDVGQKIPCPQCQTNITLRQYDLLKMACFFCHEHIDFPAHAIGEKISCPHCKMDITLKEPS